jgi:hypothetical protein
MHQSCGECLSSPSSFLSALRHYVRIPTTPVTSTQVSPDTVYQVKLEFDQDMMTVYDTNIGVALSFPYL